MKQWLSISVLYKIAHKIISSLKASSGKIAKLSAFLYKSSILEKLQIRFALFMEKESHGRKSQFSKTVSGFGILLNRLAAGLYNFFKPQLEHSLLQRLVKEMDIEFRENPYVLSGLFCAGAFLSYGAAALVRGTVGTFAITVPIALFASSVILLAVKDRIGAIVKGSLTYKLIVLAVKAVLP